MELFHREACSVHRALKGGFDSPPVHPLFARIWRQWKAWPAQPPGRRVGYSAQNPRLLACFAVLDRAESDCR